MATTQREAEIFEKVKQIVVNALGVDDDEVTADAKLMSDLGAESIDLLDIFFQLEKTFGIKIPQDELVPREILSNQEFVSNNRVNEAGLAALRKSMPHADLREFEKDPDINKITEVFTVGTIARFVQSKLAA